MSDIFSPEALEKELKKVPAEEFKVGAAAKDGDVGVAAEGSKSLGKGWSVSGAFQWMKDAGWSTWAGFSWKGKP